MLRILFAAALGRASALTLTGVPAPIYDQVTPKLRIQTAGYDGDGSNLKLQFVPKLSADSFSVVASPDQLSVLLKKGAAWPLPQDLGEVTMYLISVQVGDDPANVLESPIAVATVLATPSVMRRADRVIYMTGTQRLIINGTNFREKDTSFSFDPPLYKDLDFVLSVKDEQTAQLTLRSGRKWRSDGDVGPLKLTRIDTGAGSLRVDYAQGGVTVAEVQADLGAHGVTVETTADKRLYQSSPKLSILGHGFNTTEHDALGFANVLRWGNALKGAGVNYTISEAHANELKLELVEGSKWRVNTANLPGQLILLAVNAGAGAVPVGPTEAKKGRAVATIYEDPAVLPALASDGSPAEVFRTFSHELWVLGRGFVRGQTALDLVGTQPDAKKALQLRLFVDYTLVVFNSTHLRLSLRDGKAWAESAGGELRCVGIDTGAGPFPAAASAPKPVVLGKIEADEMHKSGAVVTRTATTQQLYETPALRRLTISGESLCGAEAPPINYMPSRVHITFKPAVAETVYKVKTGAADAITLELNADERWPVGALYVTKIKCGDLKEVYFGSAAGVGIATILADPTIDSHTDLILYSEHSKRVVIHGTGFTPDTTELTLTPTAANAFTVVESTATELTLELVAGKAWASALEVKAAPKGMALRVVKVDSGAGEVRFSGDGVVVATIVQEPEGDVCDDSCDFSDDGICDDGTDPFVHADDDGSDDDYGTWDDVPREDDAGDGGGAYYYDDDDYEYFDDEGDYLPACALGTDCTDCQPRGGDAHLFEHTDVECDNSCSFARDGVCDDKRTSGFCALGTDCQDCGPATASNFTAIDDEFWDDDAPNWYWHDDEADEGRVFEDWDDDFENDKDADAPAKPDDDAAAPADHVGSVRSVPGPFDRQDDGDAYGATDATASMFLALGLLGALPFAACAALKLARRGGGKQYLPLAQSHKADDLAASWTEMSARSKKSTTVPLTPDNHFSGTG